MVKKARQLQDELNQSNMPAQETIEMMLKYRTHNPNQSGVWFQFDKMRKILDSLDGVITTKPQKRVLHHMREQCGTSKGIICGWFKPKDTQLVLDLIGDDV